MTGHPPKRPRRPRASYVRRVRNWLTALLGRLKSLSAGGDRHNTAQAPAGATPSAATIAPPDAATAEKFYRLGEELVERYDLTRAETAFKQALALNPSHEDARASLALLALGKTMPAPEGVRRLTTGDYYLQFGDINGAFAAWEAQMADARQAGDVVQEIDLLIVAGSTYLKLVVTRPGATTNRGVAYLTRALELARQTGRRDKEAQVHVELGGYAMKMHSWDEAAQHFETVLAIGRAIASRRYEHLGLGNLGGVLAQTGRLAEAARLVESAVALAEANGNTYDVRRHRENLVRITQQIEDQSPD
jgi:tetratricopeptide (TPR) repeat protein